MIDLRQTSELGQLELESIRRFLQATGYIFREPWGRFLQRYSKKVSSREFDLLVPASRGIVDFDKRLYDLLSDLSEQLKTTVDVVIREIVNSGFQVVRLVANEGSEENTLSYDAGIDLLTNGMVLIDSSATLAVTGERVSHIRGRRPDAVRQYLDRVRIGQTEVGSFVVTLLMPAGLSSDELGYVSSSFDDIGIAVAENFNSALRAAEDIAKSHSRLTDTAIVNRGLTHNFAQALANMVESVDTLSVGFAPTAAGKSRRVFHQSSFDREGVAALREVEERLSSNPPERQIRLSGVITAIRESSRKASGTVTVEAVMNGETRSVRIDFSRQERHIIADCFERKADVYLTVSGRLIDQNGHLRLLSPNGFDIEPRGRLA